MKLNIDLYCDGNSNIGYGHVRRSLSLYNYFLNKGFNVTINGLSPDSQKLVGLELDSIETDLSPSSSVAIVDTPLDCSKLLSSLSLSHDKVVTLDFNNNISVDLNIVIFEHEPLTGPKLVGLEYIIVREEILAIYKKDRQASSGKRALVCIGGADIQNQGLVAASELLKAGFEVDWVLGPFVKEASLITDRQLTVHRNPGNFAELMSYSDIAVANGGGTMFELNFLQIPTIAIPQTSAEQRLSEFFFAKNGIIGIGTKVINDLLGQNTGVLKQLVDGQGMVRIEKAILKLL